MLNKRRLILLSLLTVPVVGLAVAFAQPGRDRGGDKGAQFRDPNFIFNMMSGGKDYIDQSDINNSIARFGSRDPGMKERYDRFMQQQGITNGRITRDQFALYMQMREAERNGGTTTPSATPTPGQPNAAPQIDEQRIKDSYQRRIQNAKDGLLRLSDLTSDKDQALREEFDKWDKNRNGIIEYDEYREYYIARMQFNREQYGDRRGSSGAQGVDEFQPPAEEEKRVVYRRLSDLPKELPPWFVQVPHKNPGQIALYEWKNADRPVNEFRKYDRNADGFITVEEVLAVERKGKPNTARPGTNGANAAPEPPAEEPLLVLAGPGADLNDTPTPSLTIPTDGGRDRRPPSGMGNPRGPYGPKPGKGK